LLLLSLLLLIEADVVVAAAMEMMMSIVPSTENNRNVYIAMTKFLGMLWRDTEDLYFEANFVQYPLQKSAWCVFIPLASSNEKNSLDGHWMELNSAGCCEAHATFVVQWPSHMEAYVLGE
jgi:hypothetical protein